MDKVTISLEFLASVLGTDAGSIPQEEAQIEGFLKGEIKKKIDNAHRTGKDEAFGRAKRETAEAFEKSLSEKLGVDKADVDTMIDSYVEKNKKSFKADPKDIRNSDVYIEDMKAERAKVAEAEAKANEFKSSIEKERVSEKIRSKAIELMSKGGYVLPTDETKRNNQIDLFVSNILNSNKFKSLDNKKIQILDAEGNVVRNELMDEVDFESFLTSKADSYFEVSKADRRKAPENGGASPGAGGNVAIPAFKTQDEYANLLYTTKDPAVREAMAKKFDTMLKAGDITE